jgi:hypothetical protein
MTMTKRILIAVAIFGAIYGVGLGIGVLLYATGTIATGALHADCGDPRDTVAERYPDVDEHDLPQSEIKAEAEACLAANELTEEEAFRGEYLFWPMWPAAICALVFLLWPWWARILDRQEKADELAGEGPAH